jgi:hypothetical protein
MGHLLEPKNVVPFSEVAQTGISRHREASEIAVEFRLT